MSLLGLLTTYKSPLTLLLAIFAPSLLPRIVNHLDRKSTQRTPRPPLRLRLKLLLALHTLYWIWHLLLPPFDLFLNHHLPILAPNETLRRALLGPTSLHSSTTDSTHPLLDLLLQKLQSLDGRYHYARFGHEVMTDCVWCTDKNDYMRYSLPSTLKGYVIEACVLGALGWDWVGGSDAARRAERWRSYLGWSLGMGLLGESNVRYWYDLRTVEGDCLHLASTLYTLRNIAFILLPLLYLLLPLSDPGASPSSLIPVLSNAQNTMRLGSLARNAIARDVRLQRTWVSLGDDEAQRARLARSDAQVQQAIMDARADPNQLMESARAWVRQGWRGLIQLDRKP